MKPVKGLSSLFLRSLSPMSASMKENASMPSTKSGTSDDETPRKEPRDLEGFLLRLPLTQVVSEAVNTCCCLVIEVETIEEQSQANVSCSE